MRRLLAVICALALTGNALAQTEPAQSETDDTWKKCRANDSDVRLSACSRLIDAGNGTQAELASAHYARGSAYRQKGLFALALEDFNAALALLPADITSQVGRGQALEALGRSDEAVVAYEAASALKAITFAQITGQTIARVRLKALAKPKDAPASCPKGTTCL